MRASCEGFFPGNLSGILGGPAEGGVVPRSVDQVVSYRLRTFKTVLSIQPVNF